MNVFEKLQSARVALQGRNLKKSGKNKFANYDYYELKDFLPEINEIFAEKKLFSQVSFNNDFATLQIINIEKPEEVITFTSPATNASVKGALEIQNLGATQTYQRRYLYLMALEITESDGIDCLDNDKKEEIKANSINYKNEVLKIVKDKKIASEVMSSKINNLFGDENSNITFNDLNNTQLKKLYEVVAKWK